MCVSNMIKLIMFLTLVLIFPSLVYSQAGLVWRTESDFIKEGETKCMDYGLYNPWPEDSNAALYVGGDLVKISDNYKTDIVLINSNTFHEEAITKTLCFTAGKDIYKEDCILPTIGCQQTCFQGNIIYEGQISVISEDKKDEGLGGSSILTAAAAPLSLVVKCEEHPRDFKNAYIYGIIIVGALILFSYFGIKKSKSKRLWKK